MLSSPELLRIIFLRTCFFRLLANIVTSSEIDIKINMTGIHSNTTRSINNAKTWS